MAAAGILEAGIRLLESLTSGAAGSTTAADQLTRGLSGLFTRDERNNRTLLSIPLPESVSPERIATALSTLLGSLARAATASKGSPGA